MQRHVFIRLCDELKSKDYLHDSQYISVYEQVAMFLLTIGHNCGNFLVQDVFQYSGQTVSRYFQIVLRALATFAKEMIKPPSFDETPSEILKNMKYYPWFKDCIGAIDGTHIPAIVPTDKAVSYRSSQKNKCTQNVMAVCSFDMRFTWIWPGWEGSATDFHIFTEATTRLNTNFPHPPQGKYYVVDACYPNTRGYLAPYKGCRYHLQDYRSRGQAQSPKEIFNHAHSSLRNIIEKCFGVLKARFPILKRMAPYSLQTQVLIVVAAVTLHNYIRQEAQRDWLFEKYDNDELIVIDSDDENEEDETLADVEDEEDETLVGFMPSLLTSEMDSFRDSLANLMQSALG